MLSRVFSCAVIGLEGVIVEVEVDTGPGLPSIIIVGLPDAAVQESRERVQAAVKNAGLFYPRKRVTVNLAPAAVRKEGPAYDLPIALGVLVAAEQIAADKPGRIAGDWRAVVGWLGAPRARGAADGGGSARERLQTRLCA